MFVKLVTGTVTALALLLVGALAYRTVRQRRTAQTLTINTPNGIVEEHFVRVGGIDQWIQIRGEDRDNPVMLILHGGPGWSNSTFTLSLRSWEKHFTVVQWDHRGTGKTLRRNAWRLGTCFEVPFFLFQGESDVVTLTSLAEEYFAEVEAPVKEMSLIRNAGHFAAFTQPEQFLAALLQHVLPLASAPGFDTISSPGQPANLNQR